MITSPLDQLRLLSTSGPQGDARKFAHALGAVTTPLDQSRQPDSQGAGGGRPTLDAFGFPVSSSAMRQAIDSTFTAPPSYSPELDFETFKQYLTPALYGDKSFDPEARAQWTDALGLDVGGKAIISIDGLDASQFLPKELQNPWSSGASGGSRWEAARERSDALANIYDNPEWRAAVDKAMADPDTIYQIAGDRIGSDGSTTGGRERTTTKYKVVDGKMVPVAARDFSRESSWNEFRDEGLPMFAAVAAPAFLPYLTAAGATAGGVGGATNAALIDSALGTVGYGASSASPGFLASLAASAGIPEFAQLPGYGEHVATLADAAGASPFTGVGAGASGAVDPISAYLTSGAAEGSTFGNALTGAGGAAGAVGANTAAGALSSLASLLPGGGSSSGGFLSGLWDAAKGFGGKLLSGDPTARNQLNTLLGAIGAIDSYRSGKSGGSGPLLSPQQAREMVAGPGDKFSPAAQANVDKFFSAPLTTYKRPSPTQFGADPFAPRYAEGGGVEGPPGGFLSRVAEDVNAGGPVRGEGGGQDDLVDAALSPGEYVFDADVVSALGDGSNEEGARRLDEMRKQIRAHKRSAPASEIPPKARAPLAYFKERS